MISYYYLKNKIIPFLAAFFSMDMSQNILIGYDNKRGEKCPQHIQNNRQADGNCS